MDDVVLEFIMDNHECLYKIGDNFIFIIELSILNNEIKGKLFDHSYISDVIHLNKDMPFHRFHLSHKYDEILNSIKVLEKL